MLLIGDYCQLLEAFFISSNRCAFKTGILSSQHTHISLSHKSSEADSEKSHPVLHQENPFNMKNELEYNFQFVFAGIKDFQNTKLPMVDIALLLESKKG